MANERSSLIAHQDLEAMSEFLRKPAEPKPQRNIMEYSSVNFTRASYTPSSSTDDRNIPSVSPSLSSDTQTSIHSSFPFLEEYSSHYAEDFHLSGEKVWVPIPTSLFPLAVGSGLFFLFLILLVILCISRSLLPIDACLQYDPTPYDSCYCEELSLSSNRLFLQPSNTISAFGFSLVGLLILGSLAYFRPAAGVNLMTSEFWCPVSYGCIAVLMGPTNAALHASMTAIGGFLDTFASIIWLSWILCYNAMRLMYIPKIFAFLLYFLIVALFSVTQIALEGDKAPVAFIILTGVTLLSEVLTFLFTPWWRERYWSSYLYFIAGVIVYGLALMIWQLSKTGGRFCYPGSWIQGHAVFQLMSALAVGLLYFYYRQLHPGPDIGKVIRRIMKRD